MKQIKLTPKQKEVILAMREMDNVFAFDKWLTKFKFKGETFRYDKGSQLAYYSGLMEKADKKKGYYKLTELGKTIQL